MDIVISLTLLAIVLTPLAIVVRDLWRLRAQRRDVAPASLPPLAPNGFGTYPSLSLLEDMEDTMPACLRRTDRDGRELWGHERYADEPSATSLYPRRR